MASIFDGLNVDSSEDALFPTDGSGPISRSSVTHVATIVSKFDDLKNQLVREIGFEGILELPHITKVDRKFTLWLLSKVDTKKRSIVVNDQCVANVIDFEVARIMGIPCASKEVCPLGTSDKKTKQEFIQHFIGCSEPLTNSLAAAEKNVSAQYGHPTNMSLKDRDNFKVSFVVWVIGHLLAPTKNHNVGGDRFWGALLDPDGINQFNWCAYVIDELMIAARDVQNAMRQKKPINAISGCSIVLQILYFEEINMGSLNRLWGILPRVKVCDGKSLSLLIAADKACSASGAGNPTWGSSVRHLPDGQDETIQLTAHLNVDGARTEIPKQNKIINDFGTFIRDLFGDKITPAQSVAFSWFHARCTQHYHQMRLNIQEDTIELVGRLFASPTVPKPVLPAQGTHGPGKAVRQSFSEPWNPLVYGTSIQKKRGVNNCRTSNNTRAKKKHNTSGRQYELPETLPTGMSIRVEDCALDEIGDSDNHSGTDSHNEHVGITIAGLDIEVPSFDLGIDDSQDNLAPDHNATVLQRADEPQQAHIPSNSNKSSGFPNLSPTSNYQSQKSNNSVSSYIDFAITDGTCVGALDGLTFSITPPSQKSIELSTFSSPDQRFKNSPTSPGTLSKMLAEGDLVERMTRADDCLNINIKPWYDDYCESPIKKRVLGTPHMALSPWIYHLTHRDPPSDIVDKFFQDVSSCNYTTLNRPWIAHTSPRHIEIDGIWISKTFMLEVGMGYDVFDLSIRRLKQLDGRMYSNSVVSHRRHILESEFAMLAMAGEILHNRKSIIEQFTGSSIYYRIEDCRMIVVPAYILLNWSCYFFDLKDKCVHVIDPLFNKAQLDVFKKMHCPNVAKVATELTNCFDMFFENWIYSIQDWDIKFVQPPITDAISTETGMLTLIYMREFDGCSIKNVNREILIQFMKVTLYELLCIDDNPVKLPINLTLSLDD